MTTCSDEVLITVVPTVAVVSGQCLLLAMNRFDPFDVSRND